MRVLVAGAGAVGSWLGAALARGGSEVVLVARGAHGDAIGRDGLGVAGGGLLGVPARLALPIAASIAEGARQGPFDAVLVAVRSFDTEAVGLELAASCPGGTVVSFQNGIGNEAVLTAAMGHRRVPDARERALSDPSGAVAATLTQPAWLVEPGVVAAGAKGGAGIAAGRAAHAPLVDALAARLAAGGVPTRVHADAAAMKWSKLALNLVGAATSALLDRPPRDLLAERRWFGVERAVLREALAVMRALDLPPVALPGYPVPAIARLARSLPEPLLHALFARRLASARSDRLPGLAADVASGRGESEVDALHGAVAAAGAVLGVATPMCRRVRELVVARSEGRPIADGWWRLP